MLFPKKLPNKFKRVEVDSDPALSTLNTDLKGESRFLATGPEGSSGSCVMDGKQDQDLFGSIQIKRSGCSSLFYLGPYQSEAS